jgi:hypothetical protein
MTSDTDLPHQTDNLQPTSPSSSKPLKLLALLTTILLVALVAGIGWDLLGTRRTQNTSRSSQRISSQPLPTVTVQSGLSAPSASSTQANPTPALVTYRNESLGFEFKHDKSIYILEETGVVAPIGSERWIC